MFVATFSGVCQANMWVQLDISQYNWREARKVALMTDRWFRILVKPTISCGMNSPSHFSTGSGSTTNSLLSSFGLSQRRISFLQPQGIFFSAAICEKSPRDFQTPGRSQGTKLLLGNRPLLRRGLWLDLDDGMANNEVFGLGPPVCCVYVG